MPAASKGDALLRCSGQDYVEAIAQLALYPPGREALLRDPTVVEALQQVMRAHKM